MLLEPGDCVRNVDAAGRPGNGRCRVNEYANGGWIASCRAIVEYEPELYWML